MFCRRNKNNMRTSIGKKYFSSGVEMDQYFRQIKLVLCPHCKQTGFLIGHGSLRGYAEDSSERVCRGRRFFCSNRYRKTGCGRTFSIALSDVLIGFVVRARTLFDFLILVSQNVSIRAAWKQVSRERFSEKVGYRLWNRFAESQFHVRALLDRIRPPPVSEYSEPLLQLIEHLLYVFHSSYCPIAAFQKHFQVSFFE